MLDPPPKTIEHECAFLDAMSAKTDAALASGMDAETLSYLLRQLSTEAAMKGGPVPLYKHSLLMEDDARTLRAEFLRRFPDFDTAALIDGKIIRK